MKEHCNHECVCSDYKAAHSENGEEECYGDPEPCKLSCYHRSRPLSEHDAELLNITLGDCKEVNDRLLSLYPNDFALQLNSKQIHELEKEHDAEIAKKERERVLDEICKFECDTRTIECKTCGVERMRGEP